MGRKCEEGARLIYLAARGNKGRQDSLVAFSIHSRKSRERVALLYIRNLFWRSSDLSEHLRGLD